MTVNKTEADRLVAELLFTPEEFEQRGLANELLKQFLRGYPIIELQTLLRHPDGGVKRAAIWIASELPSYAPALLGDAVRAISSPDRYVRYYALDVVVLGAVGEFEEEYAQVVLALDPAVKDHALFLVSSATNDRLLAAMRGIEKLNPSSYHLAGLRALMEAPSVSPKKIEDMIEADSEVDRLYGLAIAERSYGAYPDLLQIAARSNDTLIASLANHMLHQHKTGNPAV
jgi:hypothetical protein